MLDEFIRYLESERRFSALTVRNYRRDILRFLEWLEVEPAQFDPQRVTPERIRQWILYRTEQGRLSAGSVNRELSSLRAWFRYMLRQGAIGRDPLRGIGRLRMPQRLPSFVPESRMEAVREELSRKSASQEFVDVRDALILTMLYGCGLRLAELIGIDRDDLAADMGAVRIRGKGDKERMVPLLDTVRTRIKNYLELIRGQNICNSRQKALFLTQKGERISRSVVYRLVRGGLGRAGVQGKRSPHVLRHTFATELLNDGADMREIQELMGHASLQATQVYTHNSIARLREVYLKSHPRGQSDDKASLPTEPDEPAAE